MYVILFFVPVAKISFTFGFQLIVINSSFVCFGISQSKIIELNNSSFIHIIDILSVPTPN